ncbi:FAD-dependent oxidoreductase, partial [Burkholderia contaminans]|uniref:FAD-dependent oxidoreductase n=1 Tax=Burkholderia contaminans TaxID=488447 RepID=UPI001E3B53C1
EGDITPDSIAALRAQAAAAAIDMVIAVGGGKALVNAYYRSAEALGVRIRYDAPVDALELEDGRFKAARIGAERIEARACVLAAGGFESNREWLREAWGRNERGEWPADNFLIRGTR